MASKEALRERAITEQVVPSRISVAKSNAFLHLPGPPKNRKVFLDAIAYGHTKPSVPCTREMDDIIWNELALALVGKEDAKTACMKVTPIINDLLRYSETSGRKRE
jgi:hypothetical protein